MKIIPDMKRQMKARDAFGKNRSILPDFVPETDEECAAALMSWAWRMYAGTLYKITTKNDAVDDDTPDIAVPFWSNQAQIYCRP